MSNIDANTKKGNYQFGQNHVIEGLWLTFHNNAHSVWILKPEEAVILHEKVKEFNPKQILELGTGIGCSTAVMAFSAPEAQIYTVDQSQKCIDLAKTLIPTGLQERIYFRKATPRLTKPIPEVNPFVYWSVYNDYDWIDYDFIFVDGPGPFMATIKDKDGNPYKVLSEQPNGDVLFQLHRIKPGTIIYIDKRKDAVHLYTRHLLSYDGKEGYLEQLESTQMHSIYKRTNKPAEPYFKNFENQDLVLYDLNKFGYFNE